MKSVLMLIFAGLVLIASVTTVHAQSAETIWLTANTTAYKTGETVTVLVNAVSATPIRGFTFQIRYDPACLRPVDATSPIPGMNALALPQISGLVDGSYASTAPQAAGGVLAEVHFVALKGCQTNLNLETAALAIRSDSGFAAPLAGVTIGERGVALNIDSAVGVPQPTAPASGSTLPLTPAVPARKFPVWIIGIMAVLLGIVLLIGLMAWFRRRSVASQGAADGSRAASSPSKRGPR